MFNSKDLKVFLFLNTVYTIITMAFFYAINSDGQFSLAPLALSFVTLFSTFSLITLVMHSFKNYRIGPALSLICSLLFLIPIFQAFYYNTYGQGFDIQILSVLIREPRFVINTIGSELTLFKSLVFGSILGVVYFVYLFFFGRGRDNQGRTPHFYFHNKYVLLALLILIITQIKWSIEHDISQITIRPLYPLLVISLISSIHYIVTSKNSAIQKIIISAIPILFLSSMYFINMGSVDLKKRINLGGQAYTSLFGAYFIQGALGDMKQNTGVKEKVPNIKPRFNVLFILNDSQRWDILDINGFPQETTKSIKWFLKDAYNFQFPIAPANFTDTSLPGIFYGLGSDKDLQQIKDSLTIWDFFAKNADTFYYSDSDITWSKLNLMVESVGQKDTWSLPLQPEFSKLQKNEYIAYTARKVSEKIRALEDKKWFGVWNTDASHYPYIFPESESINKPCDSTRETGLENFRNCYIDANFYGFKLYDQVLNNVNLENTVVIMTSDHGEGMNEHGYMLHGKGYYQEIVKVPLIIYIPKSIKHKVPPENINNFVENTKQVTSLLDITPTILHLHELISGEKLTEYDALSGQSLFLKIPPNRVVFSSHCYPQYRCYSREILLVNNDFYGIFDPTKGFIAVYDTWRDLDQKEPLNIEDLYRHQDPKFMDYLRSASRSHPLAQSISTFYKLE